MPTRGLVFCTLALLFVATVDGAAQQHTQRFDAAGAPMLAKHPHPPVAEYIRAEQETPSYNVGRIVMSTLGTAVGGFAGVIAGVALSNNPYGPAPGIGGALGAGTGAALGLLLPGGAPKRVVGSTLRGTAVGVAVSMAGFVATGGGGISDLLWISSPLVGAHIGFSMAISSD